ncbi:MAG: dephospho-CoA kinase [Paracoccus sp. (in: a-proteobacteria)]|nr:dephospho-CoA kinase [Paracoccus sp. (in: a-proteobacteria)]
MTYRLGLTGSVGMGKSTTSAMFADRGHPVWDADAAVHQLYAKGGAAVAPVGEVFPGAIKGDAIDRAALRAALAADPDGFARLEAIVHPLVAADRASFLEEAQQAGAAIAVFDIPLLFETGPDAQMDGVAVVSAGADLQRSRVLSRPGMTAEAFALILSRQMSDAEKRARADWVIPTETLDGARAAVARICAEIEAKPDA